MNADIDRAKQRAKVLATYLHEIGNPISHGQSLNAIARLENCRDWNVYVANTATTRESLDSSSGPDSDESSKLIKEGPFLTVVQNGEVVPFVIEATFYSGDNRRIVHFDAAPWFMQASDIDIQDVLSSGCSDSEATDLIAIYMDTENLNKSVNDAFKYIEIVNESLPPQKSIGYCVSVSEGDVFKYLHAFRYPLYVQFTLASIHGSVDSAQEEGFFVKPDPDQAGYYYFVANGIGSDISYPSIDDAWTALGREINPVPEVLEDDKRFYTMEPESGALIKAKPTRKPGNTHV